MSRNATRRAKLNPRAPMLIVMLMIIIVIGIIGVMFWVFVTDDMKRIDGLTTMGTSSSPPVSSGGDTSGQSLASSGTDTSSDGAPSDGTASDPASSIPTDYDPLSTVVGETAAVDKSYFNDAVFIGDSISKGLKLNGVLPPGNVIADQNVGIDQIANDKPVYQDVSGNKKTLFQMLSGLTYQPTKVYIMLGSNGLPHYTNDVHMKFYNIVLDRVIKTYPDAVIYVESVTPITKEAEETYAKRKQDFTNKKINEFNEFVKKMCEDKGVHYVSVRDALVDGDGYMKAEFNSGDGVHFKKSGHEAMYQYFKTHTVPNVVSAPTED